MEGLSTTEQWSDRIHPVIVKELRQTVRSGSAAWLMQGGGILLMAVLLYRLGGIGGRVPLDQPLGRDVFLNLVLLLFFIASLLMVLNAGNRIMSERTPGDIDLLYTTPMSAPSIVAAKLFCGIYDAFLLFSMSLPALFLTTLLRGVDALTVLSSLMFAIPLLIGPLQFMIFVGTLRIGQVAKGLLGLGGLLLSLPICFMIFAGCVSAMVSGGSGRFFATVFSAGGISVIFVYLAIVGVMHGLSIAQVATPGGRIPHSYGVREVDDFPDYRF